MRIAIPSDDEKTIAMHTGRCTGFAIYSIEGSQVQKLEYRTFESAHQSHEHGSQDCAHGSQGDSGHSHQGLLGAVHDCDVFLAIGMGPRLVKDLQNHGLRIVFSSERDIAKAIDALANGRLIENESGSACHKR